MEQAIDTINKIARTHEVIPPQFHLGDLVWLEATHLKLCYQKTKLAPKQYGPFLITKEISPVAYQLRLPTSWGIHDVFHAYLLSPYHKTMVHGPNSPGHHLTLSMEKRSMKWNMSSTTDIMGEPEHSNTSSNGKGTSKVTTPGSQLTRFMPLNFLKPITDRTL